MLRVHQEEEASNQAQASALAVRVVSGNFAGLAGALEWLAGWPAGQLAGQAGEEKVG